MHDDERPQGVFIITPAFFPGDTQIQADQRALARQISMTGIYTKILRGAGNCLLLHPWRALAGILR